MLLGILFFIVALLYASVGFGGGSSYVALLVLWQLPFAAVPVIGLICNIVVVSGSSFHYIRAGHLNWRLTTSLTAVSIPMAYLGGRLPIGKQLFITILFVSLMVTGLRLLIDYRRYDDHPGAYRTISTWLVVLMGAILGFLAGVTGIGGGIFLAPVLYNVRAGSPKQIATTTSIFILLNSISGLIGQLQKGSLAEVVLAYWYLPLLTFAGGQIGNLLMLKMIPARFAALLTALLVLFVGVRLGLQIWVGKS